MQQNLITRHYTHTEIRGKDAMKQRESHRTPFRNLCAAAILLSLLSGCTAGNMDIRGAALNPNKTVPLKKADPPQRGAYTTEDLAFDYQYTRSDSDIRLSGNLTISQRLSGGYQSLSYFFFYVYFADAAGNALGRQALANASFMDEIDKMPIEKKFPLPAGTEAMAFGYKGSAKDPGDRGVDWEFWDTPVK